MDSKSLRVSLKKMHEALVKAGRPLSMLEIAHMSGIPELEVLEALNWDENDLIKFLVNSEPLNGENPREIMFVPIQRRA
jgi:hypothetical protein